MEAARLQIPPTLRGGPNTLSRKCTNNSATRSIYLPTRPSPNTGLRLSWFRHSPPRWTYAPAASEDCSITTPVSVEEEDQTPTLEPKAWFYLFAEASLCYLIWSPSDNVHRFVFIITSSIALASIEFSRKFVREHIHDMRVRESRSRQVEGTPTSDCSKTALPSSSLEFRQDPNSAVEKEVDVTITLHPKVWFYLVIAAPVVYLYFSTSKIKLLLAFAITTSTALGCVEFYGKFMRKFGHYWALWFRREVERARTYDCSGTTFPSSSIEISRGPNPGVEDDEITMCYRKSSIQVDLLLPVWGLAVKHFHGHGCEFSDLVDCLEREKQKGYTKLDLSTKPQQITETERTLTAAYSRTRFPSAFPQDKHVSVPTTKDDKTNTFKRILLILFCLGVAVLCFYFFLVTVLDAMQCGKPLLRPLALCYSLWTPSEVTLRAFFPITSFLAMAFVGFFRIVLQEHLRYMQKSEYPEGKRECKKEVF